MDFSCTLGHYNGLLLIDNLSEFIILFLPKHSFYHKQKFIYHLEIPLSALCNYSKNIICFRKTNKVIYAKKVCVYFSMITFIFPSD